MASLEQQSKTLLEGKEPIQEKIASTKAVKKELGKMLSVVGKMNDKVAMEFDDFMDNKTLQKILVAMDDLEDELEDAERKVR